MSAGQAEPARETDGPVSNAPSSAEGSPPGSPGRNSVLGRVLAGDAEPPPGDAFREAAVESWTSTHGTLADGRPARVAASCLVRPQAGDRVVVWAPDGGACWVTAVLERAGDATVLSAPGPLTIEAPRIGMVARTVHVTAGDFLTNTRSRHSVEDTRTEVARVRVADVGTDIRRTTTAADEVGGTFLQRTGTWISKTAREARFKARTFLFD